MSTTVLAFCHTCAECQRSVLGKRNFAPIRPYHTSYPGIMIHVDCTPGSKQTKADNSHILAIIDSFTGYLKIYPIPQPDGKTMAKELLSYICINSMPLKIVSDNGPEFANELVVELALLLGLKYSFIAPYNSRSNGKVENIHKTVQTMIRAYIEDYPEDRPLIIKLTAGTFAPH